MGKTKSRRGKSAAPAARPSRKQRRRGKRARAASPAKAFAGETASASPSANALKPKSAPAAHARPPHFARLAPARTPALLPAPPLAPEMPPRAHAVAPAAPASYLPPFRRAAAARIAGPSLRQDIPRPPLRLFLLRTRRHGVLAWQHGRERWQAAQRTLALRLRAAAARAVARALARLDRYIWQPVMWPFRPAQRALLGGTLAALSVALVAVAWIVAYNTLAPTRAARVPAPPPALSKPITGRVVSHALPAVDMPTAAVPLPMPAPRRR